MNMSYSKNFKKIEIVTLTQLRCVAVLFVFLCHSAAIPGTRDLIRWNFLAPMGQIGVGLFFILSGYVLGYNYVGLEITSSKNFLNYLWIRLVRLYPTHILTLLLAVPLIVLGRLNYRLSIFSVFTNVTLLQTWFPSTICFNTCSWALSMELFFYCVFPGIAWLVRKTGSRSIFYVSVVIYLVTLSLCGFELIDPMTAKFFP